MVVLATSVCTKNGKVLVSRQFVSIPRSRIEGLLAAFPKLLSGNDNQQHTFIETTSVRYLYQRFEDLFLVVITNKASNIVEDLETLRILTKVVPDYCGATLNEKAITDNGFELIFAFDEVVSLGYKESVTLEQIRTFTELDSHEEKIHEMIEKNKEREAREEAKRRMKEIEREKREREKMGITSGMNSIGSGSMGGMGSGMGGMGSGMGGMGSGMGGMGSGMGSVGSAPTFGGNSNLSGPSGSYASSSVVNYSNSPEPQKSSKSEARKPRRGLQIVKKPQSQGLIEQLNQEGDHLPVPATSPGPVVKEQEVIREAVQISISERISCSFDNEGGLQQLQVLGEFLVTITDTEAANAQILFQEIGDLQTRIHPNINRDLYSKGVLAIVQNKSYPLDNPTGVLKWRLQTTDDNQVPIRINVWPSSGSHSQLLVNVEYELNPLFELSDVSVKFNIVGKSAPIISTEQGSTKFDSKSNTLEWYLPLINKDNSRGTLDIEVQQWDNDSDHSWLFPVLVNFVSNSTFARLKITSVQDPSGNPIPFSEKRSLEVQQYTIGNNN